MEIQVKCPRCEYMFRHGKREEKEKAAPGARVIVLPMREVRACLLAATGKRNAEIGRILEVNEQCVKNYLRGAMKTIGVSNRAQLAALLAGKEIELRGADRRTEAGKRAAPRPG